MYGHTSTMKALTELLDSFRGTIGDTNTGGFANPPPCARPKRWFKPIKLFSDLGNPVARSAIIDEGTFIMEEIKRKAHDLVLNGQEPERIYLGGWEMVVLPVWFDVRSVLYLTYEPDNDDKLIEIAIDGVSGTVKVYESDAETFIEVVAKQRA